jgi:hypothetical protein
LCESYQLSSKAFFQWWNCQPEVSDPIGIDVNSSYQDDYTSKLLRESESLNKWELELGASELPTEPLPPQIPSCWTLSDINSGVEPLHFPSHGASVSYAYYVTARAMQCSWGKHELDPNSPVSHDCVENDYWTTLLLRVVRGIKQSDCVRENVYTIGISGLLLACVLRSTDLTAGVCIEAWLKEFQQAHVFEEGSLPIAQNIAVVSMINRQRRAGYDIFAISPALEDDGHGGNGKFHSYHNQTLSDVVIFGRDRRTGCAYSSCVSLKNDTSGE